MSRTALSEIAEREEDPLLRLVPPPSRTWYNYGVRHDVGSPSGYDTFLEDRWARYLNRSQGRPLDHYFSLEPLHWRGRLVEHLGGWPLAMGQVAAYARVHGGTGTAGEYLAAVREAEKGELKVGAKVKVHSLQKAAEHNGKVGELVEYDEDADRWAVKLGDRLSVRVRHANLIVVRSTDEYPEGLGGVVMLSLGKIRESEDGYGEPAGEAAAKMALMDAERIPLEVLSSRERKGVSLLEQHGLVTVDGKVSAELTLAGIVADPVVTGTLSVRADTLVLEDPHVPPIHDLVADLRLLDLSWSSGGIRSERLEARVLSGKVTAGRAELSHEDRALRSPALDLTAKQLSTLSSNLNASGLFWKPPKKPIVIPRTGPPRK